jgi:hypothetical protein
MILVYDVDFKVLAHLVYEKAFYGDAPFYTPAYNVGILSIRVLLARFCIDQ